MRMVLLPLLVAVALGAAVSHHKHKGEVASGPYLPSPKCWTHAATFFVDHDPSASDLCTSLPADVLKGLALEIARCHLGDVRQPLFDDKDCNQQTLNDVEWITRCLPTLTPNGFVAYTQFVAYVQQLCTRLTQHVWLDLQQAEQRRLIDEYATMTQASVEQWRELPEQVQSQLQEELDRHIQGQRDLHDRLQNMQVELQHQLRDQLSLQVQQVLSQFTLQQGELLDHVWDRVEARDASQQRQIEAWSQEQSLAWQLAVAQQHETLSHQQEEMDKIAAQVNQTVGLPWKIVQQYVDKINEGCSWASILFHFLVSWNLLWLITRPGFCSRVRVFILGIAVIEALTESAMMMAVKQDLINEADRVLLMVDARRWAHLLECAVYTLGILGSMVLSVVPENKKTTETPQPSPHAIPPPTAAYPYVFMRSPTSNDQPMPFPPEYHYIPVREYVPPVDYSTRHSQSRPPQPSPHQQHEQFNGGFPPYPAAFHPPHDVSIEPVPQEPNQPQGDVVQMSTEKSNRKRASPALSPDMMTDTKRTKVTPK